MSFSIRLFSGFVTSLPAILFLLLTSITAGREYFWKAYFIVGVTFLAIGFTLGFYIPALVPAHWKRHTILWILIQGLVAWMAALLVLVAVNLTPLCIGQDNGDGCNDLALCMLQTTAVSIVSAPAEFILLGLTSFPGGWLIKRLVKREAS